MYVLGISNLFAAEAWNAYSTPYSNELTLEVRNLAYVSVTNHSGLSYVPAVSTMVYGPMTLPSNFWEGGAFKLPLFTNVVLLTNATFRFGTQRFDPISTNYFERGSGYPFPDWFLAISNRFWFILSEGDNLVDFVDFRNLTTTADIDGEILSAYPFFSPYGTMEDDVIAGMWDTNRLSGSTDIMSPTRGVFRQVHVALGNEPVSDTVWTSYNSAGTREDKQYVIDRFRIFCGFTPLGTYGGRRPPPTTNVLYMQTPFCPLRKIVKTITWQANDPLVHSHVGDLLFFPSNSITEAVLPPLGPIPTNYNLSTLGLMNRRYSPWGGNPNLDPWGLDPFDYNPAVKDPRVWRSDEWDFPTGQSLDISWIGRVHRGTPWQTIYLKHTEPEATAEEWRHFSADYLWYPLLADPRWRFVRTHPTNDWALASLLAELWNTNSLGQRVSINSRDPAAWASVWNGVTVLSNNLSDEFWYEISQPTPPSFATFTMTSNSPQAGALSAAVSHDRASQPGGYFRDLADILTVRELSTGSPWLNASSSFQWRRGLTDAALETIPAQVLARLRADPIVQFSPGSGTLIVSFPTGEGGSCRVESSPDLEHWSPVGGVMTITHGVGQVTIPVEGNPGGHFFRAKFQPAP